MRKLIFTSPVLTAHNVHAPQRKSEMAGGARGGETCAAVSREFRSSSCSELLSLARVTGSFLPAVRSVRAGEGSVHETNGRTGSSR